MWAAIRRRLRDDEAGLTLIELLVAAAMGVVLMAGVVTVMMGALRAQPKLSEGAANVQTVRFALERITRELRNGFTVGDAKPTTVSVKDASGLPQLTHPVASGVFRVPQCGHSLIPRTITPDAPPLPRARTLPRLQGLCPIAPFSRKGQEIRVPCSPNVSSRASTFATVAS